MFTNGSSGDPVLFITQVAKDYDSNRNQRYGQYFFNVLGKRRQDLALRVYNTNMDPFYDDANLNRFMRFILENW